MAERGEDRLTKKTLSLVKTMNSKLNSSMSQNNVTSAIALIPQFSGEDSISVVYFITQFNNICDLMEIEDSKRHTILKNVLIGKALKYLNDSNLIMETNTEALLDKLKAKFFKVKNFADFQLDLEKIKQTPSQSVKEIADDIEGTINRMINELKLDQSEDFFDQLKMQKFLESVRSDLKYEIQKFDVKNFKDALKTAERLERVMKLETPRVEEVNSIDKLQAEIEELKVQNHCTTQLLKDLIQQVANSKPQQHHDTQHTTQTPQQCMICNKKYHLTADCWYHPARSQHNHNRNQHPRYPHNQNARPFRPRYQKDYQRPKPQNFNAHTDQKN